MIEPENGSCIADVTFTLNHIVPIVDSKVHKLVNGCSQIIPFEETSEKTAVRFEGENYSFKYEITLCQYVDYCSQLPINPSVRFACIANSVQKFL